VQAHHTTRCTCGCESEIEAGDWIVPDDVGGWTGLSAL